MPVFSVEQALILGFFMHVVVRHTFLFYLCTKCYCTQIFKSGSAHKKGPQNTSIFPDKKKKKRTNGFGSRDAHKYCCIVRESSLLAGSGASWLMFGRYEFMHWLLGLLGTQVIDPHGNEGSKNTFDPVLPPTLPNSTPHLSYLERLTTHHHDLQCSVLLVHYRLRVLYKC